MRRGKPDANQAAIVRGLRDAGCSVVDLKGVGGGVPDILVGLRGRNWLLEIKDGAKVPSERLLRPSQVAFRLTWRGQCVTVESLEQALGVVFGAH